MDAGSSQNRELLSVDEVAGYLGVGPVTIYRWCREERLPCMKIGRVWRIRRQALEDFLERSEQSFTLAGRLRSFLEIPDNILSITQDIELMHRLDVAFFGVGESRGGTMIKYHSEPGGSLEELRAELEKYGLAVSRLEGEGRLRFVEEKGPPGSRVDMLRRLIEEEGGNEHSVWVDFDWEERIDFETAIEQQRDLADLVQDSRLVVNTSLLERALDGWSGAALRRAQVLHSGTIWLSGTGMAMSRVSPPVF